jgi:serine/threonine protein kinase
VAYLELSPADPPNIGPYRLLGRLGAGHRGQTYLAQAGAGSTVALKILSRAIAADPVLRAQFSHGVAAAQRVRGRFTVPVLNASLDEPLPWVATAYVPGPTLGQLIGRQGGISSRLLLALGAGLAEGLREIHAAGVVHRDLKPSNVVLGGDGPRIVDFSVAMLAGPGGEPGWIVGPSDYGSPEQERGGVVGQPSDIFSLGAVLTAAAIGRVPFGQSRVEAEEHREPGTYLDLAAMQRLVSPIVGRCFALEPADRPTAAELAATVYDLAAREFGLDALALQGMMGAISASSGPDVLSPWSDQGVGSAPTGGRDILSAIRRKYPEYEQELERELAPTGPGAAQPNERETAEPETVEPGTVVPETVEPDIVQPETAVPPDDDPYAEYGEYDSPNRESPGQIPPAAPPPSTQPAPPAPGYAPAQQPPAPAAAPAPENEREPAGIRFLTGELPGRAPAGVRVPLLVMIGLRRAAAASAALKSFTVPPSGTTVVISVSAPGLVPEGDLEQDLFVPFAADSEPIRFGFVTGPAGLHTVVVRAFSGGTFLGELTLQVSVEPGAVLEQGPASTAELTGLAAEPGEVTLQVSRTDEDKYSFQLIGEAWNRVEVTRRLAGDPTQVVGALVEELRAMSANESRFANPALVRNRIKNLGAQLWADVVPEAIRQQFWEQGDRIKLFTIASDMDTVPWELLYPVDGDNDNGFLVEQFPVVRRVYGQGRTRVLRLDGGAAYIVPPGSPVNAMAEVDGIRGIFPGYVRNRGVHETLAGFNELLEAVPSVLHFACHNAFTEQGGSVIRLGDGPLRPSDLAIAVQAKGLAAISPLVFLNACRTAGDIAGLMHLVGWARQFMGAGAGAFIGSLWAVRSSSAKTFAEAFYRAMISDGMSLGAASLRARQEISGDPGDPTWLAYTVYGNPSAAVGQ